MMPFTWIWYVGCSTFFLAFCCSGSFANKIIISKVAADLCLRVVFQFTQYEFFALSGSYIFALIAKMC